MTIYNSYVKLAKKWYKLPTDVHRFTKAEFINSFMLDVVSLMYFRICSNFKVDNVEEYLKAAAQYFEDPEKYNLITDEYIAEIKQLQQENPEYFI